MIEDAANIDAAKTLTGHTSLRPDDWRPAFLSELRRTGSIAAASQAAHISRITAFQRRQRNPQFNAAVKRAIAHGKRHRFDSTVDALYKRGVDGLVKPIYQNGKRVDKGEVREYDTRAAELVLRVHRPDLFGTRAADDGRSGINLNLTLNVLATNPYRSVYEHGQDADDGRA